MASDAGLWDAGTVAGVSGCGGRGATRSGADVPLPLTDASHSDST